MIGLPKANFNNIPFCGKFPSYKEWNSLMILFVYEAPHPSQANMVS